MAAGKMRKNEASTSNSNSGGNNSRGKTVVFDRGRRKRSCGYCKSSGRNSISRELWAHSITVDDYQDLLDRGWRRAGCYLYKPEMERTCCPAYTIRLKASGFVPSKQLLRVRKRMQRFLDGALNLKKSLEGARDAEVSKANSSCTCPEVFSKSGTKKSLSSEDEGNGEENVMKYVSEQVDYVVLSCTENGKLPKNIQLPKALVKKVSQAKRKLLVEGAEDLMYSCNIAFQIAAALRRALCAEEGAKQSTTEKEKAHSPNIIAEELAASLNLVAEANGLTIRACNEHPQGKRRKLEIVLKKSSFDPEEFALYRKYQMKVHNDTPDHLFYKRFLVDTPLVYVPPTSDGRVPPCGFGSFHQQYIIDGQLVAVGVIDILPKCLSSKYLFWDTDFASLSLGKYTALQEIDWVKENQVHCPTLEFYYLGYYIHSCSKMRYKAAYRPSELLCPLRYQWVPFDAARPLLDRKRYAILSDAALLQHGESVPTFAAEDVTELHHDNDHDEDQIDVPLDD